MVGLVLAASGSMAALAIVATTALATGAPDTTPPVGTLTVNDGSGYTTDAAVTVQAPATDDVGVVGYRIYRNGNYVGSSQDTTYIDDKVQAGKQYDYQVTAVDAAGNESDRSNTATAHT